MVLVDTSIWVLVFRRFQPLALESVVDFEQVVTCPPVIQEVLQGIRDETAYRRIREALTALPVVESPMALDVYHDAASLYRAARRAGVTVRSSIDCLIATCALRHSLTVLHHDRDFTALATIAPLSVKSLQ